MYLTTYFKVSFHYANLGMMLNSTYNMTCNEAYISLQKILSETALTTPWVVLRIFVSEKVNVSDRNRKK